MISRTAASSTIGSMPPYVTIVVSPPAKPLPEKDSAGYGPSVSRQLEVAQTPVHRPPVRPPVHELVLDEEDRVVIGDRRVQQRADVVALARRHDLDAGHAQQHLLQRLAVRRAVAAAPTHRRPHDERHSHLVVEHRAELRDPVHGLVEAERDEVAEHDLEDRPPPAQGHAGGDAEDRALRDRRRDHALRPASWRGPA